jgi:hypothetical protein
MLLVSGVVLLLLGVALVAVARRRIVRLSGPRRCAGCRHTLAALQDRCPECARPWGCGDPGSAGAFPEAEAWCVAARRLAFGGAVVLGLAGAWQVLLGLAFALDAWPIAARPNATWLAPLQTARAEEPWTADDAELLVMVRGEAAAPDGASPGNGLARVHAVRAREATRVRRTEPVTGLRERLWREGGLEIRRQGDGFVVAPGGASPSPPEALAGAVRAGLARAFPDVLPPDSPANERAAALLVRAVRGESTMDACVWGERLSTFISQRQLRAHAASSMEAAATLVGGAAVALALLAVAGWCQLRSAAPITKARSA